jgi:hypothetical protein
MWEVGTVGPLKTKKIAMWLSERDYRGQSRDSLFS